MHVLLLDDEQLELEQLEFLINKWFPTWKCEKALNRMQAIKLAEQYHAENQTFQLALIDIKIPGNNGLHIAHELKEIMPNMDIIVISAFQKLEVKNLKKYYPVKRKLLSREQTFVKAVDDVSFTVQKGETLGIVGESGCGKSTMGRTILQLQPATDGEIIYKGKDITNLSFRQMRPLRKEMQIVFQDPYASLNARKTIQQILLEPFEIHRLYSRKERLDRVHEMLEKVGLNREFANRYPHEFSGGQRQRIGIARALMLEPEFVVADEPVSALDVSVQAQVLNLLQDLQEDYDLTYLFIAHDLSVVKHISTRIGVMYLGRLVELVDKNDLYREPLHPYTQALLSAIPIPKVGKKRERIILKGDVPNPENPPVGCPFHTRCRHKMDICSQVRPELKEVEKNRFVACHLYNDANA